LAQGFLLQARLFGGGGWGRGGRIAGLPRLPPLLLLELLLLREGLGALEDLLHLVRDGAVEVGRACGGVGWAAGRGGRRRLLLLLLLLLRRRRNALRALGRRALERLLR
jgi:hypothetical protein